MNTTRTLPSPRLFLPVKNLVRSCLSLVDGFIKSPALSELERMQREAAAVREEIRSLISQKNYPCVAALKAFHKNDYQIGVYKRLGEGTPARDLRQDLLHFLAEQKRTGSTYLSFFAVFEPDKLTEENFELALWRELSLLTSVEERDQDWGPGTSADPADPSFRFSLGGSQFFVVGLHPNSSRLSRRLSRPVLIFNIWDQFAQLIRDGQYEEMIKINRQRDEKFQGQANPMVVAHGDDWESIQFSGRQNTREWKCPFAFLKKNS